MNKRSLSMLAAVVLLAGCGTSDKDRAVSGGAIGAGAGAAAGLLIGGALGGFILGGAVGAATGLVTDTNTIDLGPPVWEKGPNDYSSRPSTGPATTLGKVQPPSDVATVPEKDGDGGGLY